MSTNGSGNEENRKRFAAQDNDQNSQERRNRPLVKSFPSRATRITLRGMKATGTSRPPWNSGSPSPTSTKAKTSIAKRSTHTLHRTLPIRGKIPAPEAFSSPNNVPPAPCPTPETPKLTISLALSKTSISRALEQSKDFPKLAAETGLSESEATSNEDSSQKLSATTKDSIINSPKDTFLASQLVLDDTQDDSFFDSEIMTSPRLKLPLSSPAPQIEQCRRLGEIGYAVISPRKTYAHPSGGELVAASRRRAGTLSGTAHDESQIQHATPTQPPPFHFGSENPSEDCFTFHKKPYSIVNKKETSLPTSSPQPILYQSPQLSNDEERVEQEQGTLFLSKMVKLPSHSRRAQPTSHLQLDSEAPSDRGTLPQSGRYQLDSVKPRCSMVEEQDLRKLDINEPEEEHAHNQISLPDLSFVPGLSASHHREARPSEDLLRTPNPKTTTSKPSGSRSGKGNSRCIGDRESSGEEYAAISRSIINRSRQLRQSTSQSSFKSVKWDPAIIACGPKSTIREPGSIQVDNALPNLSDNVAKKSKMEDGLESFKATVTKLKKGDRKAIRILLEALKNLGSDDEQDTKPEQTTRKETNESSTQCTASPVVRLNPRAAPFRETSLKGSAYGPRRGTSFLNGRRKRQSHDVESKDKLQASKAASHMGETLASAVSPSHSVPADELPAQEPTWIKTSQTHPTILDQEDEGFQEFCRANNFIPLVPLKPLPIIRIGPGKSVFPIQNPYLTANQEYIPTTYSLPFDSEDPASLGFETPYLQPFENGPSILPAQCGRTPQQSHQQNSLQDMIALPEETSEPTEEDGCREAKALDPAWGAQILENFAKKYPMTGKRLPERLILEQHDNQKSTPMFKQKQRPKSGTLTSLGIKQKLEMMKRPKSDISTTAAAQLQQKLEMLLLQQKEKMAPQVYSNKTRAAEIQQKLEIMLYKLKEQKALEGSLERVSRKAQRSSERSSETTTGQKSETE